MKDELAEKTEILNKLEKDKKEVSAAKDKAVRKASTVENEISNLKDNLAKLEAEKQATNFGKSERDKLKTELEKSQASISKLKASIDSLTREKEGLSKKIKDMVSGGEKTQEELHKKNSDLISQLASLGEYVIKYIINFAMNIEIIQCYQNFFISF